MDRAALSALLYEFLDAIYLFQRREEGLFGASWQDIFLLKKLADSGPLSVSEAAAVLRVPLFAASRMASRLESLSLVVKSRLPENGRVVTIGVAAKGKRLLRRVEDYQFKLIAGNIGVLEAEEVESMSAGIVKLRSLLAIE
jgi:Transcriptional regulators